MNETMETQRSLIEIALSYAERNWPVLPLHTPSNGICSCSRDQCNIPGKHPRTEHGLSEASTDEKQVKDWWSKWPDANIGILTGERSGLIILDVDVRDNGPLSLGQLRKQYKDFPQTLTVRTPTGGRHFYFSYPAGLQIGNKISFRKGLDIRANGGFVVAPISIGANGRRYEWINPSVDIADIPAWLIEIILAPKPQRADSVPEVKPRIYFADAPGAHFLQKAILLVRSGEKRNPTGFQMALQLRDDGLNFDQAETLMFQYAEVVRGIGDHPYTDREAIATLRSVYRHPPRERAKGQ